MIVGRLEPGISLLIGFCPQLDSSPCGMWAGVAFFCPHYPQLGMVKG